MSDHRGSVFVDTSAWYALASEREDRYDIARRVLDTLKHRRGKLVTSNFVVAETHALILNRRSRFDAARWLLETLRDTAEIVRVDVADEEQAVAIIEGYRDKAFSYTDATSFAVMDRLRITTAFSFDRHFAQFGLTTLGHDS